ncbi:MAG: hypothetical protein QOE54_4886 [Streptosporangiaceae bacterium]|jgi:hypothetical protein|nr:hypothetical protein [Streptosporangiaceae bacterium]MDX6432520.1 hypothetical protein [Streptosporangiaceae bacterium]
MRARIGRLVLLLFVGWAVTGCGGGFGPSTDPKVCGNGGHPSHSGKELMSLIQAGKVWPKDLRCLDLTQIGLTKADLRGVDLRGTDLTQATLKGADLRGANLSHARLDQAELDGARLDGADLSWADLTQADLVGARLDGADLSWADFGQADLTGASLTRANVWAAMGTQATVSGIRAGDLKGQWPFYALPVVVLIASLILGLRGAKRTRAIAGTSRVKPLIMPVPSARLPLLSPAVRGHLLVLVAALAYAAAALLITSSFATITVGLFTPLLGWRLGPLEFGELGGAFPCLLTGVGIAIFAVILTIRARRSRLS